MTASYIWLAMIITWQAIYSNGGCGPESDHLTWAPPGQVEYLCVVGLEAIESEAEARRQLLGLVSVLVAGRVESGGDRERLGGVQVTEHFLAGSVAVGVGGVELVVSEAAVEVEHLPCGWEVLEARAVAAIAQRHGSEDDAGDWFVFRGHAAPCVRRMSPAALVCHRIKRSLADPRRTSDRFSLGKFVPRTATSPRRQ